MSKRPDAFSKKNVLLLGAYYLFLFVLVAATTTSFVAARYHTESIWNSNAHAARFNPEIRILTEDLDCYFSNADAKTNQPYATRYAVRNYTGEDTSAYSEVALRYSLIYYIPEATLAKASLFQLTQIGTTARNSETVFPITPVYDLAAFKAAGNGTVVQTISQPTADPATENREHFYPVSVEETFTCQTEDTDVTDDTFFPKTFTAPVTGGDVTIQYERAQIDTATEIYFAIWLEDSTLIEPQLIVTETAEDVNYIKLTISRPEFVLEPGRPSEHIFDLLFMPTQGMSDTEDGSAIDPDFRVEWNAFYQANKDRLVVTDTRPHLTAADENIYLHLNLKGIINHSQWRMTLERNAAGDPILTVYETPVGEAEKTYTNVLVGYLNDEKFPDQRYSYGKTYPCRMNALFEQID